MDKRLGKIVFGVSVFGATLLGSAFLNPVYADEVAIGMVTGNYVNIRTEGSLSGNIITRLNWNDTVTVLGEENGWYHIKLSEGKEGWIYGKYLNIRTTSDNVSRGNVDRSLSSRVIDYAKKFLGTRYVYGGSTPSTGFDCSGFVKYVFSNFDYELPRTADEQATVGEKVSYDSLIPGDLVFFRTEGSKIINHAGIYIGNGEFINSSSGGGRVRISPIYEGYYKNCFATARRIIK
ncbi:MAG: NlpC/P60 family protein [Thermoanaerobacteraceae bacterium]